MESVACMDLAFDIDVLSDGGVVGFGRKKSNGLHLC